MQRSVELKQVIGALCRLLAASGLTAVPAPDTFRRAKFGGGAEVEEQFWKLLSNIFQKTAIVSCEREAELGGEHRRVVCVGLWQTGYHADWLYVSEGGSPSGRALLLALGWLLAAGALETLLTQQVQQLDKTLLTPTPMTAQLSTDLHFDPASLRKLQWLIGHLRHQGRSLLSMQEERTHLLHAVLFASLPSSALSSGQNSAVLKEDCVCMRQLCDLLEAYLNWKQVEKVFWTWMDSVMDCPPTCPAVETPPRSSNGRASLCHHGNRGLDRLEDMILRLPTAQSQMGVRQRSEDRGEGGQVWSDTWSLQQVYRARLQTEGPVRGSRQQPGDGLRASGVSQLLLHAETVLLDRRDKHRLDNKTLLQDTAAATLDTVVLIPP